MTSFSLESFPFNLSEVSDWGASNPRHRNWPVVYLLTDNREVYIGESINAEGRMRQHLESTKKNHLRQVRVVLDDTFNKSACLDLESFLIRMFSGDGRLRVLNSNAGITNAEYYDRPKYERTFNEVFEKLRTEEHLFQRTMPEIINSDLFKLSPFKALNHDQGIAVEDILDGFFADLETGVDSIAIVNGSPGTGKTIVATYLLKLIEDIRRHDPAEPFDVDSIFSDFFTEGHAEMLTSLRAGFVIPQQSLRKSVEKVFAVTPGLNKRQVLSPFQVGESKERFDLLVVDEAHRLNHRANQPSGPLNKKFETINERLFGEDRNDLTQLDWIRKQAKHTILMLDTGQSVRPADLPQETTAKLLAEVRLQKRVYPLRTQMRVAAGQDYVKYIRELLSDNPPAPTSFGDYDLRFFTDLGEMRREIAARDSEHGLSRLLAGFAWPWKSRKDKTAYDIEIDGERLRWNQAQIDWVNSPTSVDEVGSIHTIQGYDLNYAGVIIGKDLRYDAASERMYFDRSEYYDKKGLENNPKLGITYSDEDVLAYVRNIYSVLLTRAIYGTYIYVSDSELRQYLQAHLR